MPVPQRFAYPILSFLVLITALIAGFIPRISQDPSYHQFADSQTYYGIPNTWNVLSNLPFCLIGVWGMYFARDKKNRELFACPADVWTGFVLFAGVFLVGLGSGYYHLFPNNQTLVFDRIPMTIVFMSLTALLFSERTGKIRGYLLLILLNALGTGSVLYWYYTEGQGLGDLRPYAFVQFGPMLLIPGLLLLFRKGPELFPDLGFVFLTYVLAKVLEHFDKQIYSLTGCISGHTLKHLAASISVYFILHIFIRREPVVGSGQIQIP